MKRFVLLSLITQQKQPREIWVDNGTDIAWEFKKSCKAEGLQIYSTMSDTKATFAERTKRQLKNIAYCYIEDYGYKYFRRLP